MEIKYREKTIEYLKSKEKYDATDLELIVALLRSEGGCPWDMEQTHESIRKDLIEETYETIEAIDNADSESLCEELGDVMLQVMMHSRMGEEDGKFTFLDVTTGVCAKMIERHPHVFGEVKVNNSSDVLRNWDKIKQDKKGQKQLSETLGSVSKALPSLMRASKLAHKAAKVGVKNERTADYSGVSDDELAAMLFGIAAELDRRGLDAERALYDECDRFMQDVEKAERSDK